MPRTDINDIKPGMILEEPAMDSLGRVLLEAGEKLTEKYITKLKAFGIAALSVRTGEPAPATGASRPKMSEQRRKEITGMLQAKFAHCADVYQMKTIYEAVLPYLTGEKE
ncbi:MAG: hypothetical protein ACYS8W_05785 [Planctomycetota bacterium]|jgi:hypothetical protein